ncbi:cell division protein ZipA [Necropsobacter massiliensis]|uniref:cell division protein ZipA n=1 Tax=Necropsobacter massiliensis TaxID=1400001 RepID=UPI000595A833|nr:cell division protein ZipA [Necropsobacter massiliensis]
MDLNTILIILGVIALIILVAHGLWANRREKSRYFQNANTFTKDSRIRQAQENLNSPTNQQTPVPDYAQTESRPSQPTQQNLDFDQAQYSAVQENRNVEQAVSRIKISLPDSPEPVNASVEPPVYAQNTNFGNRTIADIESSVDENEGINSSSVLLREQLAEAAQKPLSAQPSETVTVSSARAPEPVQHSEPVQNRQDNNAFIMLYVVAPENREFNGTNLAQVLDDLGFIFGRQQIYHRHLDLSVASPVLFSAANIQQPGTFDVDNMADFYTVGIALFMQLPSHGNDLANLRMMIRAAKTIAEELGGFVLTDQQEIFNEQAEKAYLNRVSA